MPKSKAERTLLWRKVMCRIAYLGCTLSDTSDKVWAHELDSLREDTHSGPQTGEYTDVGKKRRATRLAHTHAILNGSRSAPPGFIDTLSSALSIHDIQHCTWRDIVSKPRTQP